MPHQTAAWLLEIAIAIRVFGPDAVRLARRLLTAGVRVGITGLVSPARTGVPLSRAGHTGKQR